MINLIYVLWSLKEKVNTKTWQKKMRKISCNEADRTAHINMLKPITNRHDVWRNKSITMAKHLFCTQKSTFHYMHLQWKASLKISYAQIANFFFTWIAFLQVCYLFLHLPYVKTIAFLIKFLNNLNKVLILHVPIVCTFFN